MHGVNLDLLHTLPHHSDGRPKDPHAHHRAEHLEALREEARALRSGWISWIMGQMTRRAAVAPFAAPTARQ